MENSKYTAESALGRISRSGGAVSDKAIYAPNVGCGTQGAIDFLVKVHGYHRTLVAPEKKAFVKKEFVGS